MVHLGILRAENPPVHNYLRFPCQNLSLIGKSLLSCRGKIKPVLSGVASYHTEMRDATDNPISSYCCLGKRFFLQMTGWTFRAVPSAFSTPKFQCLLREDGETPEWCEGERLMCAGGSWTPSIGQATRRLARRQRIFVVADFEADAADILFKPRPMLFLRLAEGLGAAAEGDRTAFLKQGGRYQSSTPFSASVCGERQKGRKKSFRNSFGLPTDPFPHFLASDVTPFAFWYEGDPKGGCIRFLTETEKTGYGAARGLDKVRADGDRPLPEI